MHKNNHNDEVDRLFYEKKAKKSGYDLSCGIDEAGRGPLAGPVFAGAVIIKDTNFVERIDDSKKLTEKKREKAFIEILDKCYVGVGTASVEEIDELNILNATFLAMKRAVKDLGIKPGYLIIDGNMKVDLPYPKICLIRGEEKSLSVACASIVAKVSRDKLMLEEDKKYPQYGLKKHKGYGTREHITAIKQYGLSPIHRRSFGPFGDSCKKITGRRGEGYGQ